MPKFSIFHVGLVIVKYQKEIIPKSGHIPVLHAELLIGLSLRLFNKLFSAFIAKEQIVLTFCTSLCTRRNRSLHYQRREIVLE